ncbi:MAG: tripartite tricarboxylate transporter substrate binding protein [Betaproteobacteria bacterium]|nr:MAG: tripartite tricarboxylate transporter substrate binding protein [Betaproteobacteria bacterium]
MRKALKALLGIVLTGVASLAVAQNWPARPVHFVVPYPAGGYYDVLARVIGAELAETLGQAFVVENRVGANGMVGTDYVAKSAPDGYTIIMGGIGPHGINPSMYPNLTYSPTRDFAAVIHVASAPNVLVVNPSVPVHNVKELIALAKAKPGQIPFSSAGSGSSQHLSGEMFNMMAGIKLNHVPYKGSAPSVTAVLGGEVSMLFGTMADVVAHVHAGKLRALAVTSESRIPALPEVPTMIESGLPGFEATAWFGVLAPAATPRPIVERLNGEINRILKRPEILKRISQQGSALIVGGTPEQFSDFIRAEIEKWGKVVRESGAKAN